MQIPPASFLWMFNYPDTVTGDKYVSLFLVICIHQHMRKNMYRENTCSMMNDGRFMSIVASELPDCLTAFYANRKFMCLHENLFKKTHGFEHCRILTVFIVFLARTCYKIGRA